MRRRRQGLQVSTFPFLAVLLCAMGSLILLLLVIDRRAKVVMRAKALEAIRNMESEDEKDEAARQAEWERRRHALHEQLQHQKQELEAQKVSIEQQLSVAINDFQTQQARGSVQDHQLQAEEESFVRGQKAVASRLQETIQKKQQSEAAQAELVRLTGDLGKIEQTLADLKALRQKQQQTYSLVPYRGSRGDNRRPIYLECTAGSLIFHPDRSTLPATESSGSAILQEVERRINRRPSAGDAESGKKETPYLLLLVRPDGIVTYYRALAALRNLPVDFGYEFVEPDWILSFPEDEKAGGTQPWMVAGPAPTVDHSVQRRPTPSGRPLTGAVAGGVSNRSGDLAGGVSSRPGDPASGAGVGPGDRQSLNTEISESGNGSIQSTGQEQAAGFGYSHKKKRGLTGVGGIFDLPPDLGGEETERATGPGTSPKAGVPNGSSREGSGVTLGTVAPRGVSFGGASPQNRTGLADEASGIGPRLGNEAGSSQQNNIRRFPSASPLNGQSHQSTGSPEAGLQLFPSQSIGQRSSPMTGNASASLFGKNDPGSAPRGSGITNPFADKSVAPVGGTPNGSASSAAVGTISSPSILPSVNALPSDSSGRSGSSGGSLAVTRVREGAQLPEGGEAGPPMPGSSGLSQLGATREKKSDAAPPVRRYIRPDWNIFIECKADQVVIYPGGSQIPLAALVGSSQSTSRPLLLAIQRMIARKQATIASTESEKDDRIPTPQIRFLVRPDGLRTYFLAFPELTSVQVPMTRENLDAGEDVIPHMVGR